MLEMELTLEEVAQCKYRDGRRWSVLGLYFKEHAFCTSFRGIMLERT